MDCFLSLLFWTTILAASLAVTVTATTTTTTTTDELLVLDCDPCIDRPSYTIRVIVHGVKTDGFWHQVRAAALQSGKDMRVNVQFDLYDTYDSQQMASDIINAAKSKTNPPDALIVTIPSADVQEAIQEALEYVPIFGMNSGYTVAEEVGVLGFVAMDEYMGGLEAGKEFLSKKNISTPVYVTSESGNSAHDSRRDGFATYLKEVSPLLTNRTNEAPHEVVGMLVFDPDKDSPSVLTDAMKDCPYDAVLLGGSTLLEHVTSALFASGCDSSKTLVGTFDTNSKVYDAIAVGKLFFAISQQQHLQGAISVVLASVYVTTGKRIARSSEFEDGIYFTGPKIINLRNLPSDTLQICESEGFPVCSNNPVNNYLLPNGVSRCPCTDRSQIKIGGVLHGVTTDSFWDVIFEQAQQAADDIGVELKLDRLEPQPTTEIWHAKMANKMISLCQQGVDGLFVTIPSDAVVPAIQECEALNVPVISINSGAVIAQEIGLTHHISMLEYAAGAAAARQILDHGGITEALCTNHDPGNVATIERCQGFQHVIEQFSNATYLGEVAIDLDLNSASIKTVEDVVGRSGDWTGVGMQVAGPSTVDVALELIRKHPGIVAGTFDLSNEIYGALDSGDLIFAIDQNPFMQGYMPVWLLTLLASTGQNLVNTFIETGPELVFNSPSNDLQICTANHFKVCPRPVEHDTNQIDNIRPFGLTMAGLTIFGSIFFAVCLVIFRKNPVVTKSQPLFLGMVCAGTFLMASSIIPLSIDDSIATEQACSAACMLMPWLLSVGFTTAFSALFSKIWRINRVMKNSKKFKRVEVRPRDVLLPFGMMLVLNIAFMLIWTFVDPMYWYRTEPVASENGLFSFGSCQIGHTSVSVAMLSCLTVQFFLVVLLANIEAYKARHISTEFSESKYVAMVMVGFLQVLLLGIPLIVIVSDNPPASYFVKSAIISVVCLSLLLLIFVPKMVYVRKNKYKRGNGQTERQPSGLLPTNDTVDEAAALEVMIYQPKRIEESSHAPPDTLSSEAELNETSIGVVVSQDQIRDMTSRLTVQGWNGQESELEILLKEFGIPVGHNSRLERGASARVKFDGSVVDSDE